jgi:hypothetical protein
MAPTKTEVREKLRELHQQAENGVRPRRHYTVNDALDDWLDGLAPATVTVYRSTIAKALREALGTVELTKLTAAAVQKALANITSGRSTRTVRMAHNAPAGHRRRRRTPPPPPRPRDRDAALRRAHTGAPHRTRAAAPGAR